MGLLIVLVHPDLKVLHRIVPVLVSVIPQFQLVEQMLHAHARNDKYLYEGTRLMRMLGVLFITATHGTFRCQSNCRTDWTYTRRS